MGTASERAEGYLVRAKQLFELAETLEDEQSKQLMIETASYYERLASALLRERRAEACN